MTEANQLDCSSGEPCSVKLHSTFDLSEEIEKSGPVAVIIVDIKEPDPLQRVCDLRMRNQQDDLSIAIIASWSELPKDNGGATNCASLRKVLNAQASTNSATLRRSSREFRVDQRAREVAVDGRRFMCSPMEFRLLLFFLRFPDIVFSREELLRRIRGFRSPADQRIIDVLVRRIRSKTEANSDRPLNLQTVRGLGYMFRSDRDRFIDALTESKFVAWPCCP